MRRFTAGYGAQLLHLLAAIVSSAIIAASVVRWFDPGSDTRNILVWLAGSVVGVDLVILPLAWAFDRIALRPAPQPGEDPRRGPGRAYVRVPAMLSGLLLLVFLPLILRFATANFRATTGLTPTVYLGRWLLASAAMFACSALLYAGRRARARRRESASAER